MKRYVGAVVVAALCGAACWFFGLDLVPSIVVGLVVYALLGLFSDAAVRLLERKVLVWRRTLAQ